MATKTNVVTVSKYSLFGKIKFEFKFFFYVRKIMEGKNNSSIISNKMENFNIPFWLSIVFAISLIIIIFLVCGILYYIWRPSRQKHLCGNNEKSKKRKDSNIPSNSASNDKSKAIEEIDNNYYDYNSNNNNNISDDNATSNDEDEGAIEDQNFEIAKSIKEIEVLLNKLVNEDFKAIKLDIAFSDFEKSNFINETTASSNLFNSIAKHEHNKIEESSLNNVATKLENMNLDLTKVINFINYLQKKLFLDSKQIFKCKPELNNTLEQVKKQAITFEQFYQMDKSKSTVDTTAPISQILCLNEETEKSLKRQEFSKIKKIYEIGSTSNSHSTVKDAKKSFSK